MKLGERLTALRLEHGYGFRRLSEATGMSPKQLRMLEYGWAVPTPETIERFAALYGMTVKGITADTTQEPTIPVGLAIHINGDPSLREGVSEEIVQAWRELAEIVRSRDEPADTATDADRAAMQADFERGVYQQVDGEAS